MSLTILYPDVSCEALEERFASTQTLSQLVESASPFDPVVVLYRAGERAGDVAKRVDTEHVLLVFDSILGTVRNLVPRLRDALEQSKADIAIPRSNDGREPRQLSPRIDPYLTRREFEEFADGYSAPGDSFTWSEGNPGIALTTKSHLASASGAIEEVCQAKRSAIAADCYVHRWVQLRAQDRSDLFALIEGKPRSVLDLGCGEGVLGAQIKAAHGASVVGIEIASSAASIAATRVDRVLEGNAEEIVSTLEDRFDCVVAGDFLEHLADPWQFLVNLRSISTDDCQLIIAIPNASHGSIAADLLTGRFDYVYIGLTCVGHLRFFTRASLESLLGDTGWTIARMEEQPEIRTPQAERLAEDLRRIGREPDPDIFVPGFYVVCRPSKGAVKG